MTGKNVIVRELATPVLIEVRTGVDRSLFTFHEGTGLFQAETQYGNYAYTWHPSNRRGNLFDFLASLDFGYFMGKAYQGDHRELDVAATIRELRRDLLSERQQGEIDRSNAREAWDRLNIIEANPARTNDEFYRQWEEEQLSGLCQPIDLPLLTKDKFECRHFWDIIWPALITSAPFLVRRKPAA